MPKTNFYIAAIALGSVCVSCTFLKDRFVKDPNAISTTVKTTEIRQFDPTAPLVSPGAEVVRRLAELDPGLARFGPDVEAAERAVMKSSIADLPAEPDTTQKLSAISPPARSGIFPDERARRSSTGSTMMFQGGAAASPADRARAASLIGGLLSGLKQIFSKSHTQAMDAGGVKSSKTETEGGVTTTMGVELDFQKDGTSAFGIEMKSEAEKDGNKLVTELKGRVDGLDCPNTEGQVPITAKLRLGGESGGVGYTQEMEAFIRATVDDNANIVSRTIDIVQGTREIVKGNDIYVETGFTVQYGGDGQSESEVSNWRLIRHSQSAAADIAKTKSIAESGQDSAIAMAATVLAIAEHKWQNGGCVEIKAQSPGTVAVNSTTPIPVKVVHKFDGADVPSKLEAALSGGASIDPALIPKTAGTLTYVAPGEQGKSSTISLKAASKRGRASLDLNASTGGKSFQITGNIDDAKQSGTVCDTSVPFTVPGTLKFNFTPSSATKGTYTYTGPFGAKGSGPYEIFPDGRMVVSGEGCIMGHCATYSHDWKATPVDPASCGK